MTAAEAQQACDVADNYLAMWRSLRRDAFLARLGMKGKDVIDELEGLARIAHSAAMGEQRLSKPTYVLGDFS